MDKKFHGICSRVLELFRNESVTEVVLHGSKVAWAVSAIGEFTANEGLFSCEEEAIGWVTDIAALSRRRLDRRHPANGGVFLDTGFRWHAVLSPPSYGGVLFSLRRHRFEEISCESFLRFEAFEGQFAEMFRNRDSLVITGPTGSGKSTLLAGLLKRFADLERVCILEDASEIPLLKSYWVKLCRLDPGIDGAEGMGLESLMAQALRLRPDRIVVGEVRYEEARVFWQSMLAGGAGTLTTIHAASAEWVLPRLAELLRLPLAEVSRVAQSRNLWIAELARGNPPEVIKLLSPADWAKALIHSMDAS